MIVTIKKNALLSNVNALTDDLINQGFELETVRGSSYTVLHILGDTTGFDANKLYAYPCVERVINIQDPYIKVHRQNHPEKTHITVNNIVIGKEPIIIAGPCSVESEDQINQVAKLVKNEGAHFLRGGAYKPRTSPYSFQGLKETGLKYLYNAGKSYNIGVISEIVNDKDLPLFEQYVDIIQVGARNMQNFELLKALGSSAKPILLKRGFGNTIEEWLMSAEYIMNHGNKNVILCERGIRTFESYTRATLDISSVLAVKALSHLPVIVDPSHAAGRWDLVSGLTKASLAAGADGVMIEVHPNPERALSDGAQSLKPDTFKTLMASIKRLLTVI
ncbi:MAG: 3-deoxy-7-phosphoheptulonate synthase [Candidatus Izemoplasmataceae bacterium]